MSTSTRPANGFAMNAPHLPEGQQDLFRPHPTTQGPQPSYTWHMLLDLERARFRTQGPSRQRRAAEARAAHNDSTATSTPRARTGDPCVELADDDRLRREVGQRAVRVVPPDYLACHELGS